MSRINMINISLSIMFGIIIGTEPSLLITLFSRVI